MESNINNNTTSPETQTTEEQATTTSIAEENTTKTFTEEEVQRMIDQRVTQAMKKAERKTEAKVREAEKLAAMDEAERYKYQLEQRELAIAEKERELALAENKAEAGKILSEKGLSLQLVDFVVADDAETMAANIKIMEAAFNNSVKAEVEKRLASKAPRQNLPLDKPIDKAQFLKMGVAELNELAQNNPELYEQLSNS